MNITRKLSAFAVMKHNKKKKVSFESDALTSKGKKMKESRDTIELNKNDNGISNNAFENDNTDDVRSETVNGCDTLEVNVNHIVMGKTENALTKSDKKRKRKKKNHDKSNKKSIKTIEMLEKLNAINELRDAKRNFQRENLGKNEIATHESAQSLDEIIKMPLYLFDSRAQSKRCFQWIIHPFKCDKFFDNYWQKKPLLVKRRKPNYYDGIFSCDEFDKILREQNVQFTKNIDITSYENDERKTLNPDGRAYAPVVWDYYQNGCSVRLLNPQTFSRSVWKLNSILQEFFGSFVGANAYLTPPQSQGFAPHYDDIEAFVLQIEGKKLWKVYSPLDDSHTLPRFSSHNFKRSHLKSDPILTVELEAGDLLYFPRGFIHEAKTNGDEHSLHITLSSYQRNTYGDLLEKLIPRALQIAIAEDVEFREGLPLNYMHSMGVANEDMQNSDRDSFLLKIKNLMTKLISYAPIDSAADQMAKGFIHDSLPPVLTQREKFSSIHSTERLWKNGTVKDGIELEPDTLIKLIRHGAVRLIMEDETVRLYHTVENSREYHEYDPQYIDIGADLAPAIEYLLDNYPNYIPIDQIPLENLDQKMEIANLLFDKGLITMVEHNEVN